MSELSIEETTQSQLLLLGIDYGTGSRDLKWVRTRHVTSQCATRTINIHILLWMTEHISAVGDDRAHINLSQLQLC